jgi:hypothetical protein
LIEQNFLECTKAQFQVKPKRHLDCTRKSASASDTRKKPALRCSRRAAHCT